MGCAKRKIKIKTAANNKNNICQPQQKPCPVVVVGRSAPLENEHILSYLYKK
jgi:hypothetical protein|tara:strand:- start:1373 stop:1528 length:156 start_codon:yes stop_codon:yes gene_type:complete